MIEKVGNSEIEEPNEPDQQRLLLNAQEAAEALHISERLLWSKTNCCEIPHIRIGRRVLYPLNLLLSWIDKQSKGVKR